VYGSGDISAWAESDLPAAGLGTGLDSLVNYDSLDLLAVTYGTIVAYIENTVGCTTKAGKGCMQDIDGECDKNYPR